MWQDLVFTSAVAFTVFVAGLNTELTDPTVAGFFITCIARSCTLGLTKDLTVFIELVVLSVTIVVESVETQLRCVLCFGALDGLAVPPFFGGKHFWLADLLSSATVFLDIDREENTALDLIFLAAILSRFGFTESFLIAKAHVILVVALTARVTWAASRVDRDGADVFFAFEGRRAALRSDKEQAKEPTHDQYTCLDARHILPLIVLVTSCQDI